MELPAPGPDRYIGEAPTITEIGGEEFWVNVHMALVDGRLVCVGLDVRSFYETDVESREEIAAKIARGEWAPPKLATLVAEKLERDWEPPAPEDKKKLRAPVNGVRFVEVNSPVMRGLRTSEVIEAAVSPGRDLIRRVAENIKGEGGIYELVGEALERPYLPPETTPRRGPKPLLDDDVLRTLVAPTYLSTVKRPVQAVRVALEEAAALRPPVTIDQARKAVSAARARGFIPPAARKGGQQ